MFGFLRMAYLPGWTFQSPDYLNNLFLLFLVAHIYVYVCVVHIVYLALNKIMGGNVFFSLTKSNKNKNGTEIATREKLC